MEDANMGKIVRPLTAIQVKNAKPKEKTYRMFDGGGLSITLKRISRHSENIYRYQIYARKGHVLCKVFHVNIGKHSEAVVGTFL